jgi:hypothetical protein
MIRNCNRLRLGPAGRSQFSHAQQPAGEFPGGYGEKPFAGYCGVTARTAGTRFAPVLSTKTVPSSAALGAGR